MENENKQPKYCQECGLSLVTLDTWCTSRACEHCGKEVYFIRPGEDGGIRIEKGDKFHVPQITLSLDPKLGGQFSRYGLEGFVKQIFLGKIINSKEEFVKIYKNIEKQIDKELVNLDCISHCDLETESGVEEATKILEANDLHEYTFKLFQSGFLRRTYLAIEEGNALDAAYAVHQAQLFKEYSLLEHFHIKEIIWLGYRCYVDLSKNKEMSPHSVKEQKLIKGARDKIKSLDNEILYALANDGDNISARLSLTGISDNTLKALLEYELEQREKTREDIRNQEELKIKKAANSIKLWGFLFTLANGMILAFYKGWL